MVCVSNESCQYIALHGAVVAKYTKMYSEMALSLQNLGNILYVNNLALKIYKRFFIAGQQRPNGDMND